MSEPSKPNVGLPPKKRMRHDRHFVDELAQRMGEGIGRMVRITAIISNPVLLRFMMATSRRSAPIDSPGIVKLDEHKTT